MFKIKNFFNRKKPQQKEDNEQRFEEMNHSEQLTADLDQGIEHFNPSIIVDENNSNEITLNLSDDDDDSDDSDVNESETYDNSDDQYRIERNDEFNSKSSYELSDSNGNESLSSLSNADFSDHTNSMSQLKINELKNARIPNNNNNNDDVPENIFIEQSELVGYLLINEIGSGAFSKVFRAIPDKNNKSTSFVAKIHKEVAVKVIKKQDLSLIDENKIQKKKSSETKSSSRQQVLKEVKIHKMVSPGCDQIVAFVDFQETRNYYYIIQELMNGGEIFGEIVRLTYFSEDLSRHVIKQLALAVKHLHSMGVVHRDIKPENLLFEAIEHIPSKNTVLRKSDDSETKRDEGVFRPGIGGGGIGAVKLVDFGLSKQIFSTNTQTPCGTVGYTAPEVVKDERYSMKVDMWGIGCVLYTILCGFPPFYDEKINILTEKIARGEYTFLRPWWDEISDGAKNAVSKLLEVDPEYRYDIDELLNDPWLNNYDCLKDVDAKEEEDIIINNKVKYDKGLSKKKNPIFQKDASLLYSPAAVAMRDAFDISNAVQRIEEDKMNITNNSSALDKLDEYIEEEMYDGNLSLGELNSIEKGMFQLKLNSSTIIKRRRDKNVPVPRVNSPITQEVIVESPAE
ncbi:hypothetical protein Kpol_487p14 [Vanderwaltozyma polyspora DSM 70294]|uniref:non-specific serine/threonine protein kinase n=1 Tax=Vanderwaltozyma polyspora (strain ATCC 22028 / DSM 70294 / BCRC 21397 / CBS 2163 / NBRC 10782 / NRRL Y-8283 / UCD 57-17) TaxID=436907 RepID=A7TQ89_VANPO|nr:uncharacterized protein Kpol_487p14 [Vanderwaltozyma polyspora DSM 70294]EDO15581.1 hypothetical protein Kpol_487p14 [Vanderwaltozyma polyspora DSM 70294]